VSGDRWHIEVDHGVCIGSGLCASSAPGGFRLDAARQAHPAAADTEASEALLAAAEGCPVEAIAIRLRDTGEAVFPPED
jgi:ferredoxin